MPKTEDPSTWRLKTANGIPYKLVERSGSFQPGSVTGKEEFKVRASDLGAFVREFFPLPSISDGNLPVIRNRAMSGLQIRASSLEWETATRGMPIDPFASDAEAPSGTYHDLLTVTVQYSDDLESSASGGGVSQDIDPTDPTTFLKINAEAAGQFLYLPSPGSKWEVDGGLEENRDADTPITIIVPMINWSLTWPMLSRKFVWDTMLDRMRAAQGKVNNAYFAPLKAPAETLLFTSWSIEDERQFLFDSEKDDTEIAEYWVQNPVNLTIHMQEKRISTIESRTEERTRWDDDLEQEETYTVRIDSTVYNGHNHMWKTGAGWTRVLYNGTDPPFQQFDFDKLFKIPEEDENVDADQIFELDEDGNVVQQIK